MMPRQVSPRRHQGQNNLLVNREVNVLMVITSFMGCTCETAGAEEQQWAAKYPAGAVCRLEIIQEKFKMKNKKTFNNSNTPSDHMTATSSTTRYPTGPPASGP
ncbi:hypothetical protein J6590_079475 [Homalodisca vitripennis]|nr:hypothetical protein J6590_079475 [Homalodisca vitripennis]